MAIEFARPRFVSRSKGHSSAHTAGYNMREPIYDERLGKIDEPWDKSTLLSHDVDLPLGAPEEFKAADKLWNHVEASEHRIDSQVAFELVVALDPTIDDDERRQQAREFAQEHFVKRGFAAQVDVHRPHPAKAVDEHSNYHAHILVPTRPFEGPRLARIKPRDFFVKVKTASGKAYVATKAKWGPIWRDFQNQWFETHGKPITVDPVAPFPGRHIGAKRFRHPNNPKIAENAKRQEMNAVIARDPQSVADHLAKHQRFDGRALSRFLAKHIADPVERSLVEEATRLKLDSLQQHALIQASYADMVGSTASLSIEDVARQINPKLDAALKETAALREEARKLDVVIRGAELSAEEGRARVNYRKSQIGISRKLLHASSLYIDPIIARSIVQERRATGGLAKLKIKKKRILDRLEAERLVADKELQSVRAEAAQELERRRRIARNARAQLTTVQKSDRVLRQKRARAPRL
jgi:hypothetical protein